MALELLFIGDSNRVVSDTAMNTVSTRSHCIFIVNLERQEIGSDVKVQSKLQLVDLSGSERAGKGGVEGVQLLEAKYINSSLFQLVSVIKALNEQMRGNKQVHIPYRGTMMTMMLRDSIGGNCKTKLIATIHAEKKHLFESLSTCLFAKNVKSIQNAAKRNESVDPSVVIRRLRQEISGLKAEISMLKGGEAQRDHLLPEDLDRCNK